jgi:hypothetical protein
MQKYVNGNLVDLTPAEITAFQDSQNFDPVEKLAKDRNQMSCTKTQGILTLGETKWVEVLEYRDLSTTSWAEKMIIDSATDWQRNSQNIQFIGYLVGYTDEQMDAMFVSAKDIVS